MPDAQQIHDGEQEDRPPVSKASRQRVEDSLASRSRSSSAERSQSERLDPSESAKRNHPGLTQSEIDEMAEELGF